MKDSPRKISDGSKEHEKKPKVEQSGKQAKDNSPSGDASKDNFIHVRARRGQATNSHSLAERVQTSTTSYTIMFVMKQSFLLMIFLLLVG